MTSPAKVAVLLSGRGSNFLALQGAIGRGELDARIVLVASDNAEALGLERARELGLPTACRPYRHRSRQQAEEGLLEDLSASDCEWICLAGFMRLLSARFVAAYPRRILNIHPSLLPSFPGLEPQAQALEHGVRISGCTVHLVDEGLDSGPIVGQRAVEVRDDDSVATLSARILEQEHQLYAEALQRLLDEPWRVEGRRVRFG